MRPRLRGFWNSSSRMLLSPLKTTARSVSSSSQRARTKLPHEIVLARRGADMTHPGPRAILDHLGRALIGHLVGPELVGGHLAGVALARGPLEDLGRLQELDHAPP